MSKNIISFVVVFLLVSHELNARAWPRSCSNYEIPGAMAIIVKDDYKVDVNGIEYKKGIIGKQYNELKKTCKRVSIIISMPKGFRKNNLVLLVTLVSEVQKDTNIIDGPTVVERN